ncbi:MAG: hypothetical protein GY821_04170 [Gammaproteobacteria bacterium]|nr:hypothetical protein [Gammaproteobacteria bacterium]
MRQSHSIFLRMFFENIQPVTRHYGAPWGYPLQIHLQPPFNCALQMIHL